MEVMLKFPSQDQNFLVMDTLLQAMVDIVSMEGKFKVEKVISSEEVMDLQDNNSVDTIKVV